MEEIEKIVLKCPHCGKEFKCKKPNGTGHFSVACINPECNQKIVFKIPENEIKEKSEINENNQITLGLLDNGNYRFQCENPLCRQLVLVPSHLLKYGINSQHCPKCQTINQFEIQASEKDLLKCQTAGCNGVLEKKDIENGCYSSKCPVCRKNYNIEIEAGKVKKIELLTEIEIRPKQELKLVVGGRLLKKEYVLEKGVHYIGRKDPDKMSDFNLNDNYASARSVRIDVSGKEGRYVYKLTVERSSNPVYHNSKELTEDDNIVYLAEGDTIKMGKTLINVQKVKK